MPFIPYGLSIDELLDEVGYEGLSDSVFEVECECGAVYNLEPDGSCTCSECGAKVESPLLANGLI